MNARKDERVRGERPRWKNAAEDAREEYTAYNDREEGADVDPAAEREAELQPGQVDQSEVDRGESERDDRR